MEIKYELLCSPRYPCLGCRYHESGRFALMFPPSTPLHRSSEGDSLFIQGISNNLSLRSTPLAKHLLPLEVIACPRHVYLLTDKVRPIEEALLEDNKRFKQVEALLLELNKHFPNLDPRLQLHWSDAKRIPMLSLIPLGSKKKNIKKTLKLSPLTVPDDRPMTLEEARPIDPIWGAIEESDE